METLRIGNLKVEEGKEIDYSDPYALDPKRHPSLLVRTQKPFNAEAPKQILSEFITPNDLFYVRNHLPVPDIKPEEYFLEVGGEGVEPIKLSLEDLKKLPQVTVAATIQCAGQRRNDLKTIKPGTVNQLVNSKNQYFVCFTMDISNLGLVRGLDWDIGAISTATWTGVKLTDVLALAGITEENRKDKGLEHVCFEGLDKDIERNYAASIPIEKVCGVTIERLRLSLRLR